MACPESLIGAAGRPWIRPGMLLTGPAPDGRLPVSAAPEILRFLKALDATQFLGAEKLQAYQRNLLSNLLRHARSQTAFYEDRLAPLFRADQSIDWDGWRDIPILTRAEAQASFDALRARELPRAAGAVSEATSSGSTGRPLRHLTTGIQDLASACCSERFFNWHKLDAGSLTARIRAAQHPDAQYPKGRIARGWRAGHLDSEAIDLSITAGVEEQVEWLMRIKPRYLATYPSNLRAIARRLADTGADLGLDAIMIFGEMTSDDMRVSIEGHFGLPVLDRYGSSEVGHISGTCPHSLKHHVSSEVVLLELLDADGKPVSPGEAGRVVVTPFYNLAMPLIRYELGDYAIESKQPCGCGRTLPLLEKIMGRTRNMFRFADGSHVWPVLFSAEMNAFVPFTQFQVVQVSLTEVEFRYVPASPDQTNDVDGLTAYIHSRLHPGVCVNLTAVTQIPRSAGGKYEDYMSLVV